MSPAKERALKVLVEVEDGVVQGAWIFDSAGGLAEVPVELCVADHDSVEERDALTDSWFEDGQTAQRFLEQVKINPDYYKEAV